MWYIYTIEIIKFWCPPNMIGKWRTTQQKIFLLERFCSHIIDLCLFHKGSQELPNDKGPLLREDQRSLLSEEKWCLVVFCYEMFPKSSYLPLVSFQDKIATYNSCLAWRHSCFLRRFICPGNYKVQWAKLGVPSWQPTPKLGVGC